MAETNPAAPGLVLPAYQARKFDSSFAKKALREFHIDLAKVVEEAAPLRVSGGSGRDTAGAVAAYRAVLSDTIERHRHMLKDKLARFHVDEEIVEAELALFGKLDEEVEERYVKPRAAAQEQADAAAVAEAEAAAAAAAAAAASVAAEAAAREQAEAAARATAEAAAEAAAAAAKQAEEEAAAAAKAAAEEAEATAAAAAAAAAVAAAPPVRTPFVSKLKASKPPPLPGAVVAAAAAPAAAAAAPAPGTASAAPSAASSTTPRLTPYERIQPGIVALPEGEQDIEINLDGLDLLALLEKHMRDYAFTDCLAPAWAAATAAAAALVAGTPDKLPPVVYTKCEPLRAEGVRLLQAVLPEGRTRLLATLVDHCKTPGIWYSPAAYSNARIRITALLDGPPAESALLKPDAVKGLNVRVCNDIQQWVAARVRERGAAREEAAVAAFAAAYPASAPSACKVNGVLAAHTELMAGKVVRFDTATTAPARRAVTLRDKLSGLNLMDKAKRAASMATAAAKKLMKGGAGKGEPQNEEAITERNTSWQEERAASAMTAHVRSGASAASAGGGFTALQYGRWTAARALLDGLRQDEIIKAKTPDTGGGASSPATSTTTAMGGAGAAATAPAASASLSLSPTSAASKPKGSLTGGSTALPTSAGGSTPRLAYPTGDDVWDYDEDDEGASDDDEEGGGGGSGSGGRGDGFRKGETMASFEDAAVRPDGQLAYLGGYVRVYEGKGAAPKLYRHGVGASFAPGACANPLIDPHRLPIREGGPLLLTPSKMAASDVRMGAANAAIPTFVGTWDRDALAAGSIVRVFHANPAAPQAGRLLATLRLAAGVDHSTPGSQTGELPAFFAEALDADYD